MENNREMINKSVGIVAEFDPFHLGHRYLLRAVRRAFPVKKVTSSHGKGRTEILSDAPLDEAALRDALTAAGYTVTAVRTEPYERRGLSRLRK